MLRVSARGGGIGAALALLLTGALFAAESLRLDLGSVGLPGPGFFPLTLGVLLMGFAATIAAGVILSAGTGEPIELGHRDVLIALAALLGVCVGFEPLGAYLTLGLFSGALLVLIGHVPVGIAAFAASAGMLAVWYFFKVLLGLQLPSGPIDPDAVQNFVTAIVRR
jgi:hypothetical protein